MSRPILILAASVAALSLAACNKSDAEKPPSAATAAEKAATPDANPAATVPTPSNEATAPVFVEKAAASDMFEVDAARLALQRAHNPEVKKFAQMMIQAHTESTKKLKAAIAASGQTLQPPAAIPSELQGKLDDLTKASAADFDKTYMDQQVDAHQAALNLMQRYAQDGDVAQIKELAAALAPVVQDHLTHAKGIRDGLGAAYGQAPAAPAKN